MYNTEKYLERCVGSILHQSFRDFELLLIDDGSGSACAQLCDTLAVADSRIQVFHKENGGTSTARNFGLSQAVGEYIAFADSDDYVLPDWLLDLYRCARESGADMVRGGLYAVEEADAPSKLEGAAPLPEKVQYAVRLPSQQLNGAQYLRNVIDSNKIGYDSVCTMLVRKELYDRCRFPGQQYFEDVKMNADLSRQTGKIVLTDKVGYCYVQRSDSKSHTVNHQCMSDSIDILLDISEILSALYQDPVGAAMAKARILQIFFYNPASADRIDQSMQEEAFKNNWARIRRNVRLSDVRNHLDKILFGQFLIFRISPELYRRLIGMLKKIWKKKN